MSLIIAGTVLYAPEVLAAARPLMAELQTATLAEDGCIVYSFAEDLNVPGLVRIFERWRDQAAVDAHIASAHMKAYRVQMREQGVTPIERKLAIYEVAAERPL